MTYAERDEMQRKAIVDLLAERSALQAQNAALEAELEALRCQVAGTNAFDGSYEPASPLAA